MPTTHWTVTCWPFGEGETEGDPEIGEPESFDTLERALLRGIEEIADWSHSLLDPGNGDAPSDDANHGSIADYSRNGAMRAFEAIGKSARSWDCSESAGHDCSRLELPGPSNEVVVIERVTD